MLAEWEGDHQYLWCAWPDQFVPTALLEPKTRQLSRRGGPEQDSCPFNQLESYSLLVLQDWGEILLSLEVE